MKNLSERATDALNEHLMWNWSQVLKEGNQIQKEKKNS